jgi:hypothetical protein
MKNKKKKNKTIQIIPKIKILKKMSENIMTIKKNPIIILIIKVEMSIT